MDFAFQTIKQILTDVLPESVNYIFQPKAEFEDYYSFILVIDNNAKSIELINKTPLIPTIQNALNLDISTIGKKVEIEVEIFDESA
ncbi:hypothetical protein SCLARK_001558 [Spiroplasma clarkii]|uniref:Uncharacterized protein n=1 Tax=Spiroplasma clarkii TaxID=2139 RepID=A0A1Y0L224_9MOLU|nr:hypothetical protein [Spiroplasma clarkii]ARU92062.1 hypothetical protein SCLARK_001558 [Spiroplasma clarkii]ATX71391.1 hypothetical protein SCLAR_v1c10910 [Spiroplasma clarkii]